MKRQILISVIALATLFATANAQVLGGYKTISSDDAEAAEAAEFAVSTKAEDQEGLSLVSVHKAERQSVQGTNFRLCIEVELDSESQFVSTVVFRSLDGDFTLKSWSVVASCGGGAAKAYKSRKADRCTGSQLRLVESDADADMGGKRYQRYVFTNISRRRCTLKGFPTVTALNRSGSKLRISADYSEDFPGGEGARFRPRTVTLRPGGRANFQVFYSDGMALDHPRITNIAKFRVTATADKKAFTVGASFGVCCGSITVGSLHEGGPGE